MKSTDYINTNKATWNSKVDYHVESDFYDMDAFLKGQTPLNTIELALLGDIKGLSALHLQCHFGQDTLSLAQMGATATGVDFSDKAIAQARLLNKQLELDARFICCDLYELPNYCNEKFDLVYTSYGTIGWLPDINKWSQLIAAFLKPEGKLIFIEFHPLVWMFDDHFKEIRYRYFKSEPIVETESGSYADKEASIKTTSITWNHGLGEVVTALLDAGLEIKGLKEYDYSPYDCFEETVKIDERKYRIKHLEDKIPIVYSVEALKKH